MTDQLKTVYTVLKQMYNTIQCCAPNTVKPLIKIAVEEYEIK